MRSFVSSLLVIVFATACFAQAEVEAPTVSPRFRPITPDAKLQPIPLGRFTTPPKVDGEVSEAEWDGAAVLDGFVQTSPGDNSAPSRKTKVRIGTDGRNLFIAFECEDEPASVRSSVAKRDDIFRDDNVRVFVDTFNDQNRAYFLAFNPQGIQHDGIYTEPGRIDFAVDIPMESKGSVGPGGWSVEARIPFRSLRYKSGPGKVWGIHFARYIPHLNFEVNSWMPYDRNFGSWMSQAGKLSGLGEIEFEQTVEIVPSLTLNQNRSRRATYPASAGTTVSNPIDLEAGVSIKAMLSPSITLDATVNPDFAEIESDAPVITANQRFPIFFEEKRPFFLEGAEVFQSPMQPFHSRTIVRPEAAAKLSGSVGRNTFAFLLASDRAPGIFTPDETVNPANALTLAEFRGKRAKSIVARIRRDLSKDGFVGVFISARIFPEQRNLVVGIDGRHRLSGNTTSQYQLLTTVSRRCFFDPFFEPSANPVQAATNRDTCDTGTPSSNASPYRQYRTSAGFGYFWNIDRSKRNSGFFVEAVGRSRFFRTDNGFFRRADSNRIQIGNRVSTEPRPKAFITRLDWRQTAGILIDFAGRSQESFAATELTISKQRNVRTALEAGIGYERLRESEFGLARMPSRPLGGAFFGASERSAIKGWASIFVAAQPTGWLSAEGFAVYTWNALDLDLATAPGARRASPAAQFNPSASQDPGPGGLTRIGFEAEIKPIKPLRVSLRYSLSELRRNDTGLKSFSSQIAIFSTTYQVSRFAFIRGRWDFDSLRSRLTSQIVAGWSPRSGKSVYAGYGDDFNINGFNPYTWVREPGFRLNGRNLFVRISFPFSFSF